MQLMCKIKFSLEREKVNKTTGLASAEFHCLNYHHHHHHLQGCMYVEVAGYILCSEHSLYWEPCRFTGGWFEADEGVIEWTVAVLLGKQLEVESKQRCAVAVLL